MRAKSSAARWFVLPLPAEAYFTASGFALAVATSSLTLAAASVGCATSALVT